MLLLPCLPLIGCGGPYTSSLSGTVRVDGKPLHRGKVVFHPLKKGGPLAYARIGPDGSYSVRTAGSSGLIPGEYAVTVVAYSQDLPDDVTPEQIEQLRIVAARYSNPETSGFRLVVQDGSQRHDIDVESR